MPKNRQEAPFQRKLQATFWEQVNERISHAHHVPTREKQAGGNPCQYEDE